MYDSRYIRTVAAGRYGGVDAEKRKSVKLMKVRGQRAILHCQLPNPDEYCGDSKTA